jgi:hypothetical protein
MAEKQEFIDLITPVGRLSFPALFEARAVNPGDTPKFSLTLLLDEEAQASDEFKAMKDAVRKVAKAKWGDDLPKKLKLPFLTTDDLNKVPDGYEDEHVVIRMNSTIQPGVVDEKVNPILDQKKVYSGCYVRVACHPYAWEHRTGGCGISFGLDHVQFVKDGEPFTKAKKPTDVFGTVSKAKAGQDDEGDDDFFG